MAETSPVTTDMVLAAVAHHLPGRTVLEVQDRGVWIRHIFRLTLDGGQEVYLKADHAFPASEKEAFICNLLLAHDLPAPRVLAVDARGTVLPAPFVVQEHVGGRRLSDLLDSAGRADLLDLYRALGRFYRRLHEIRHDHAGWIQGAGLVLPLSPHEHQYNEVIVRIGAEAVERGLLAADAHRRLQRLWAASLPWLKKHPPALVVGALPWTVYLASGDGWHVTKLMDLHDALYWDPAWDLAGIRYPAFRPPLAPELWAAFLSEYGPRREGRRLLLYRLMQHLDAAMGNYMEPPTPAHERWKKEIWDAFDRLLAEAETRCSVEDEHA